MEIFQGSSKQRQASEFHLHVCEIEWLIARAVLELEAAGEIRNLQGGSLPYLADWFRFLGWDASNLPGGMLGVQYGATHLLLERARSGWHTGPTRWENVDRLREQVWLCRTAGIDVACAVTARVAVEEAVRSAMADLRMSAKDTWPASERERRLFEHGLTTSQGFSPLDKSATRAQLSAIRETGNDAAHNGVVRNPALLSAQIEILNQTLASLSNATSTQAPA